MLLIALTGTFPLPFSEHEMAYQDYLSTAKTRNCQLEPHDSTLSELEDWTILDKNPEIDLRGIGMQFDQ